MKAVMIFFLWASMMGAASASIYKCTSADGKIEFSDRPCAGASSEPMALQHDTGGDPDIGALQNRVAMGQVEVGMTASQVQQAWGEPDGIKSSKKNASGKKSGAREEWDYRRDGRSQKVTLIDGKVVEVSNQTSPGATKSSAKNASSAAKSSAATKHAGKADERRFISYGMTTAEVRSRIGSPDSRESGACREWTKGSSKGSSKKQTKTVRDLCESCWVYDPAEGDPQTQTQVCFQNNLVSSIKRKVIR